MKKYRCLKCGRVIETENNITEVDSCKICNGYFIPLDPTQEKPHEVVQHQDQELGLITNTNFNNFNLKNHLRKVAEKYKQESIQLGLDINNYIRFG